ncbi:Cell division protein FtsQ [Aquicella siphonis]|uniref:Cell division protein FtsQ n=1 Tax=Aquicella siphonis TaxID=254247 RepID=A0A5E4PJ11_9COXI|nr:cell division protein FtsQ/DivIB [Aquicella siphonis]VVC76341.1 Cell division protein FtsQ [Aquicella siphonis]
MDVRKGKQKFKLLQHLSQILKISFLGAVIISIVFALNQLDLARYFPIKTVRVFGVNRVNNEEVRSLLLPLVSRGFFTVNVEYIRDRLSQMPWVSELYVRRIWPDQIEVKLVEKKPAARWNNESLLSEAGEVFTPPRETYPANLPDFIGPSGQQIFMLKYFNDINRLLFPLHAKISHLELTPYFTWKLTLDNGITMQIGHKDILTRLSHFVKVYPKIVGARATEVDYIDLRYPNGMAVRWKETVST